MHGALTVGTDWDLPVSSSLTSRYTLWVLGKVSAGGADLRGSALMQRGHIDSGTLGGSALLHVGSGVNWLSLHRADSYLSQLASVWREEQRRHRFSLETSTNGISRRDYRQREVVIFL